MRSARPAAVAVAVESLPLVLPVLPDPTDPMETTERPVSLVRLEAMPKEELILLLSHPSATAPATRLLELPESLDLRDHPAMLVLLELLGLLETPELPDPQDLLDHLDLMDSLERLEFPDLTEMSPRFPAQKDLLALPDPPDLLESPEDLESLESLEPRVPLELLEILDPLDQMDSLDLTAPPESLELQELAEAASTAPTLAPPLDTKLVEPEVFQNLWKLLLLLFVQLPSLRCSERFRADFSLSQRGCIKCMPQLSSLTSNIRDLSDSWPLIEKLLLIHQTTAKT